MTPDQVHAGVLAGLSRIGGALADTVAPPGDPGFVTACAVLRGRRRIVERHAPIERSKHPDQPPFCGACIDRPDYAGGTAADWPCEDYRDAAADLLLAGLVTADTCRALADMVAASLGLPRHMLTGGRGPGLADVLRATELAPFPSPEEP